MAEDYADLDQALAQRVRLLQILAQEEGITTRIKQGKRSLEEQARLYAQGRTTPGPIITYAKPGTSRHETGRAVDLVPLKDGQPDDRSPHWTRLGQLGKAVGLEWGGDWTRFKDQYHFQLPEAARASRVVAGAGAENLSKDAIQRLIEAEARRQGVDPALMVAIGQTESALDPWQIGDGGKSLGLFQLQRAAAKDAGIDPARRGDLHENIRGGVTYFKQQLTKERGHVERALGRYNWGTPTYQGRGTPTYVQHVLGALQRVGQAGSPESAEAAPVSPATSPPDQASMRRRLEMIERLEAIQRLDAYAPAVPASGTPPAAVPPPRAPAPAPTSQTFAGAWRQQMTTQQQALGAQEAGRLQAEGAVGSPTQPAPTLSEIGKGLAGPAISVAGGVGGAALGTALGGPIGTVFGEMAGSYGARRLNVALGLEEPGMVGDIASVAVPPVLRGVGKVLPAVTKAVVKRLPGASTAMHQDVAERLTGMADRLLPAVPAEQHYAAVALHNPLVTPTALARESADIVQKEMALAPGLRHPRLLRVARDLQTLTQQDVPMQDLYAHQQRVGELVRKFRSEGGVGEGRIKQLYGAFHDDLEAAAAKGIPGAQTLKDAIAASRKEHMAAEFDDLFQPGKSGITIDPEGRASINGGRLATAWKTKLRRDKVFRDTLRPEEKAEVEEILTLAQRLERLSVPRGGQRGSGRAAVGAAVGSAIGGPAGAAFAVYAPEVISKAMQTPTGRAMVKRALQESQGALDTTAINALAALVRSQMAEREPSPGP